MLSSAAQWIESGEVESEYERIDALTHWLAPAALEFWNNRPADGLRIGRDVPSRAIAGLLNQIIVYEPVDGGRDLKVHLAGSSIARRFSHDVTGQLVSKLFTEAELPERIATMHEVIDDYSPRMARVVHTIRGKEVLRLELFMVPVWSSNSQNIWNLSFCFYF